MSGESNFSFKRKRIDEDSTSKRKFDWAIVRTEEIETSFQWIIPNFSPQAVPRDQYIRSELFSSGSDGCMWNLVLDPNRSCDRDNEDAISVCLKIQTTWNPILINGNYELTLLNSNHQVLSHTAYAINPSDVMDSIGDSCFLQHPAFLDHKRLNEGVLKPSDELHIHCKLVYTKVIPPTYNSIGTNIPATLYTRFQHLFNEGMQLSDMEVHVGGTIFPAHKVVLATGSPVLQAMLQSEGFIENKTNILQIDDLEPPIVKEMLRFLYTDRVEKMDELAKDLLVAADKYLITTLKSLCQVQLGGAITIDNCLELFVLADSHSVSDLKKLTINFIIQHSASVVKSEDWKELKQSRPQLCFEVSDLLMGLYTAPISPVYGPALFRESSPDTLEYSGSP